jgi:hypothetical protein
MTATRFLIRALDVIVLAAAAHAAGDPTPYFCERFAWDSGLERVAAGPDGSVCVASTAYPADLPGQIDPPDPNGGWQAFVTVFEPDGRIRWTRFLQRSWVSDMRVAPDGAIWVATNSDYDGEWYSRVARVTKVGPDGTVLATVVLDGSGDEQSNRLALAANGDVVVVGTTTSADFPLVNAFQPEFGGNTDGFVTRIRGDGSGIVWSSYLGGAGFDDANAVAIDANGDVLVTTRDRWGDLRYDPTEDSDAVRDVYSVALVRISGDGALLSTLDLPRGDFGGAFDVAISTDGRILVGGVIGFLGRGPQEGYVLPIDPATSSFGVPWHEPGHDVHRISVGPSGEVLVGTDRDWSDPSTSRTLGGGFVLLTLDLASVVRRVDREEGWGVRDVAFAPDGALCICTIGGSAAVPFHEAPVTLYGGEPFVGRLPAPGGRAPSRVQVRRVTTAETFLEWPNDGDAVVGYDVEEITSLIGQYPYMTTVRRVGQASANAHAVRVRKLTPGATHHLRLVADFASGERKAVTVPVVLTPPARVRSLSVKQGTRGLNGSWDRGGNGDRTRFEIERSVGLGPFEPLQDHYPDVEVSDTWLSDKSVSREDGFVVYRVRAVTAKPRAATPWTYSGMAVAP